MIEQTDLAGGFTLPGTSLKMNRMGYGAMRLAGLGVWGPPRGVDAAVAVLREAVESGVNHIDTSDYYGPHVTNQIIKQALHPYTDGLVIVTKLGARRGSEESWIDALSRQELIDGVHDNLRNLGLDALDIVNLRVGGIMEPGEESIEGPLTVLAELKRQGLIRHIGLSNITPKLLSEPKPLSRSCACRISTTWPAGTMAPSSMIWLLKGSLTFRFSRWEASPRYSLRHLTRLAASLEATPMQVALAWLLHRSNILLIPGTSSVAHFRENLKAATLQIPAEVLADLDAIGRGQGDH
jgi:pyridoxine 4-dehydrogenase